MRSAPETFDDVMAHRVYRRHDVQTLFGVSRWQVEKWAQTGLLRRIPETGTHLKFSGAELVRFSVEVLGVDETGNSNGND